MKSLFYFLILFVGGGLIYLLSTNSIKDEQKNASFVPLFKIAGIVPQTISRSVTKVLPINSLDEGEFGKKLNEGFVSINLSDSDKEIEKYLTNILNGLEKYKKKPFSYHAHLYDSPIPNAMALPGGVILVTRGLLSIVKSEGELVAIMAHEMGHVELSHCFDSVKYVLLSRKMAQNNVGIIADFARNILIKHSFSKNQEDEADEYGFKLLTVSKYDPASMANSFKSLDEVDLNYNQHNINPFRDYFSSHPPLSLRIAKFSGLAKSWWSANTGEIRYIGKQNLKEFADLSSKDFGAVERVAGFSE